MRRVKHEKVSKYPNRACALNGSGCSEIFAGKVNKNKQQEKNFRTEKQFQAAEASGLAVVVRDENGAVVSKARNRQILRRFKQVAQVFRL